MDAAALEGIAIATYERVKLDPSEPVSAFALARRLFGSDVIVRALMTLAPATTFCSKGARKIAIRRNIAAEDANFLIAHEIAHAVLKRDGFRDDYLEAACDYLGGALMAPRPAMRQLRLAFGTDYAEIAGAVCARETWAALRVAEVTGTPTAVIAPRSVRVRGNEWNWPSEDQIRKFARMPTLRGICRSTLQDDPRRVVLAVEDVEAA